MDIYYATWNGTDWAAPKPVGNNINTKAYEGFPLVSADGKMMYFIRDNFSKRKDKALCYSIWASKKQEDGTWGVAEKLPAPINGDCEKSPRIMADNRTLIFRSVRKDGIGGFDLYQSFQEDDGSWATPINLDYINTEEDNQLTSVSAAGDLMYYYTSGLGYAFFSRGFKPDTADVFKDRLKKVPLAVLKKDAVVQLQDITFETGKADLKPESNEELDRLVSLLEGNQTIKVEISAHTFSNKKSP